MVWYKPINPMMKKFHFKHHNFLRTKWFWLLYMMFFSFYFVEFFFLFRAIKVVTSSSIPYNYVSTLSLSFVCESGTLPSTDANSDNLEVCAVFLNRDSTQKRCSSDFSLLSQFRENHHFNSFISFQSHMLCI